MESGSRPRLPAILLSQAAQDLIRDVFESDALFRGLPQIRTRIVQWGAGPQPTVLAHSAIVISEDALLAALRPETADIEDPAWTIFTSPATAPHSFGARMASATPVVLKDDADPSACWIESLESGWQFLLVAGPGTGWLLSVGEPGPAGSRRIAKQIARYEEPTGQFPASPRIASPLCGSGWLACGSAALAFDPLCGDGTAHAIREAILASAVIRAVAQGERPEELLVHYQPRLTAGFQRHLSLCREYYASGGAGPWWRSQVEDLNRGLDWCAGQMRYQAPFRYQLKGFELQAAPSPTPK